MYNLLIEFNKLLIISFLFELLLIYRNIMETLMPDIEGLTFEKVWYLMQETDRQMKETDRQIRNLNKKMSESENRWGKFVESLVEGSLIKLLKKKNIIVYSTYQRRKVSYNGRQYEFDIIAENGNEVVAVEVKTTLKPDDVKEFIQELKDFKKALPKYADNTIYGAVGFINVDGASDKMAEKNGLFVIKATGDSAKIINEKAFKPKTW